MIIYANDCKQIFMSLFRLKIMIFKNVDKQRTYRWDQITNSSDVYLYANLCAMTDYYIFFFLLGRNYFTWLPEKDLRALRILNFRYIRDIATRYINRTLKAQHNQMPVFVRAPPPYLIPFLNFFAYIRRNCIIVLN